MQMACSQKQVSLHPKSVSLFWADRLIVLTIHSSNELAFRQFYSMCSNKILQLLMVQAIIQVDLYKSWKKTVGHVLYMCLQWLLLYQRTRK